MIRLAGFVILALALTFFTGVQASEGDKEVTLKGKVTCAKCDLDVSKACATVIVVTGEDKKDVVYYFDAAGHKANHKAICTTPTEGSVTGVTSKKGEKSIVTVTKVELKK